MGKTISTCVYIEKEIFSRTSSPISIKLGTNHPWVKEILNYANKGPDFLQTGDNYKNSKMECSNSRIFFRTTEPEEVIFTWKLSDIM
jgi:hypothetical protein